jgi:hypothetical protein
MKSSHQSLTESIFSQVEVSTESSLSQEMSEFQTLIVYRHLKKRCVVDLGSVLHNWQLPQFDHPQLWQRSIDHTRFCKMCHAKILCLGGAQFFQTACHFWFLEIQISLFCFWTWEMYQPSAQCAPVFSYFPRYQYFLVIINKPVSRHSGSTQTPPLPAPASPEP